MAGPSGALHLIGASLTTVLDSWSWCVSVIIPQQCCDKMKQHVML